MEARVPRMKAIRQTVEPRRPCLVAQSFPPPLVAWVDSEAS